MRARSTLNGSCFKYEVCTLTIIAYCRLCLLLAEIFVNILLHDGFFVYRSSEKFLLNQRFCHRLLFATDGPGVLFETIVQLLYYVLSRAKTATERCGILLSADKILGLLSALSSRQFFVRDIDIFHLLYCNADRNSNASL